MNIFYLSKNERECAQFHNDKHVVKMILEYAQLMSTAHRVLDGKEGIEISEKGRRIKRWFLNDSQLNTSLMKATHINHPSAVWTRKTSNNYEWLYRMWRCLLEEYTYRYGKNHSCERLIGDLAILPKNIANGSFVQPPPAMPDHCKVNGNSIESYRNYYKLEKRSFSNWKKRSTPNWF